MFFKLRKYKSEYEDIERFELAATGSFSDFESVLRLLADVNLQERIDSHVFDRKWVVDEYRWEFFADVKYTDDIRTQLPKIAKKFWVHIGEYGRIPVLSLKYKEDIAYRGDDTWFIEYVLENLKANVNTDDVILFLIMKRVIIVDSKGTATYYVFDAFCNGSTILIGIDEVFKGVLDIVLERLKSKGHVIHHVTNKE